MKRNKLNKNSKTFLEIQLILLVIAKIQGRITAPEKEIKRNENKAPALTCGGSVSKWKINLVIMKKNRISCFNVPQQS